MMGEKQGRLSIPKSAWWPNAVPPPGASLKRNKTTKRRSQADWVYRGPYLYDLPDLPYPLENSEPEKPRAREVKGNS